MATQVAVDAMGGDEAPAIVVEAAIQAVRRDDNLHVVLFGPERRVQRALENCGDEVEVLPIRLMGAPEVIGMSEAPTTAVKNKKRSSIHLGLGAVKKGQADAFVSAGNTGAIMAASLFILGRLPGVERPAILGFCPTLEGRSLLIDVGSSVDCRPEHLVQFGRMGAIYAQHLLQIEEPSVALLNIGEEPSKGNEQVKTTYELFQQQEAINFVGNVEGRDLLYHAADIVVCDGFVGNIVLKFGESVATGLMDMIGHEMQRHGISEKQQATIKQVLGGVKEQFDPQEQGGLPLLGVAGNVIIGHGSSSVQAAEQMILEAAAVARQDVAGSIASAFE